MNNVHPNISSIDNYQLLLNGSLKLKLLVITKQTPHTMLVRSYNDSL